MTQRYLLTLLLLCLGVAISAQVITTNDKGERILQFPDGSWRYPTAADYQKYPVKKQETASVRRENEARDQARKQADTYRYVAEQYAQREADTRTALEAYQEQLKQERDRGNTPATEVAQQAQRDRLKYLKKQLKYAKRDRKDAEKLADRYALLVNLTIEKRNEQAAKLREAENKIVARREERAAELANAQAAVSTTPLDPAPPVQANPALPAPAPPTQEPTPSGADLDAMTATTDDARIRTLSGRVLTKEYVDEIDRAARRYRSLRDRETVFATISDESCELAFDERDEFTGNRKRGLRSRTFFTHTPKEVERLLTTSDPFISAEGYLSRLTGDRTVLVLTFTITSPKVQRQFGQLREGGRLIVRTIDGESVTLYNSRFDSGKVDKARGTTTYTGLYSIPRGARKDLLDSEVDAVRVIWSTGYEDYEVFNLDFLQQQLECLKEWD